MIKYGLLYRSLVSFGLQQHRTTAGTIELAKPLHHLVDGILKGVALIGPRGARVFQGSLVWASSVWANLDVLLICR